MQIFEQLVNLLRSRSFSVSAAESCTGGLFASEIISIAGASDIISSSFIAYSEDAKISLLGISRDTINNYGVVSEQVALEMAKGAVRLSGADVGLGITGFAGPATDPDDSSAGLVCFGFVVNGRSVTATKHFGDVGRNVVRETSVYYAASTLINLINRFGDSDEI